MTWRWDTTTITCSCVTFAASRARRARAEAMTSSSDHHARRGDPDVQQVPGAPAGQHRVEEEKQPDHGHHGADGAEQQGRHTGGSAMMRSAAVWGSISHARLPDGMHCGFEESVRSRLPSPGLRRRRHCCPGRTRLPVQDPAHSGSRSARTLGRLPRSPLGFPSGEPVAHRTLPPSLWLGAADPDVHPAQAGPAKGNDGDRIRLWPPRRGPRWIPRKRRPGRDRGAPLAAAGS